MLTIISISKNNHEVNMERWKGITLFVILKHLTAKIA